MRKGFLAALAVALLLSGFLTASANPAVAGDEKPKEITLKVDGMS